MAMSEGRVMKVGKNPITSFSFTVGNVNVEFDVNSGLLIYNRKMSALVVNGVTLLGESPEEGHNDEPDEPEQGSTRKRGKKQENTTGEPVTE